LRPPSDSCMDASLCVNERGDLPRTRTEQHQ
jgi:hypothetical protein